MGHRRSSSQQARRLAHACRRRAQAASTRTCMDMRLTSASRLVCRARRPLSSDCSRCSSTCRGRVQHACRSKLVGARRPYCCSRCTRCSQAVHAEHVGLGCGCERQVHVLSQVGWSGQAAMLPPQALHPQSQRSHSISLPRSSSALLLSGPASSAGTRPPQD